MLSDQLTFVSLASKRSEEFQRILGDCSQGNIYMFRVKKETLEKGVICVQN